MLIDEFLPVYSFAKQHSIEIDAPTEDVYPCVRKLDLREARIVRALFALRNLPAFLTGRPRLGLTFDDLRKMGFVLLGETPMHEMTVGIVGRLWAPTQDVQTVEPGLFREFAAPGFVKGAMNFSLTPLDRGRTRLTIDTRVSCPDQASLRKFGRYWFWWGPPIDAVRLDMLRAFKRQAEGKRRSASRQSRARG